MAGRRPQSRPVPDSTEPGARTGPATRRGRATRTRLLEAAHATFSEFPFSAVRIVDITKRAGVASGTFYTYFDSKEEIFQEIAARVLAEMNRAAMSRDPANTQRDPLRNIEYATRQYFSCCEANAQIARSVEELATRDRSVGGARRQTLTAGVKAIATLIERLQERGRCDRDIDPWNTALALHAMNVSVAYDRYVHHTDVGDRETLVRAVTEIWRRALGLDSPAPAAASSPNESD